MLKRMLLLIFLILVTPGCTNNQLIIPPGSPTPSPMPTPTPFPGDYWTIRAAAWDTAIELQSKYFPNEKFYPTEGNIYLIIQLVVRNNYLLENTINLYDVANTYFESEELNKYILSFPPGTPEPKNLLPNFYYSHQAQTGFIFFEIPNTINPGNGRLIIRHPDGPKNYTIEIKDLIKFGIVTY